MKRLFTGILPVLLLLPGCRKKMELKAPEPPPEINTELRTGLPENTTNIHGYLYAANRGAIRGGDTYFDAYAVFRDPGGSLLLNFDRDAGTEKAVSNLDNTSEPVGNINIGEVALNDEALSFAKSSLRISYRSFSDIPAAAQAINWKTRGNGTFKGMDVTLPLSMPVIARQPPFTFMIDPGKDLVLTTAQLASGYDSLAVIVSGNPNTIAQGLVHSVRAAVPAGQATLIITKQQLQSLDGPIVSITLYACNYANMTVASKVYLFELGNRISLPAGTGQ